MVAAPAGGGRHWSPTPTHRHPPCALVKSWDEPRRSWQRPGVKGPSRSDRFTISPFLHTQLCTELGRAIEALLLPKTVDGETTLCSAGQAAAACRDEVAGASPRTSGGAQHSRGARENCPRPRQQSRRSGSAGRLTAGTGDTGMQLPRMQKLDKGDSCMKGGVVRRGGGHTLWPRPTWVPTGPRLTAG